MVALSLVFKALEQWDEKDGYDILRQKIYDSYDEDCYSPYEVEYLDQLVLYKVDGKKYIYNHFFNDFYEETDADFEQIYKEHKQLQLDKQWFYEQMDKI